MADEDSGFFQRLGGGQQMFPPSASPQDPGQETLGLLASFHKRVAETSRELFHFNVMLRGTEESINKAQVGGAWPRLKTGSRHFSCPPTRGQKFETG